MGKPEPPTSAPEKRGNIMFASIEFAKQNLQFDLNSVRGERSLYMAIIEYFERCFHQTIDYGSFGYFDTKIELSVNENYSEISIKRYNDGCRYVWIMKHPVGDSSANYRDDYTDGFFNSTDCDNYVEEVLWTLHETLDNNGLIKSEIMVNDSYQYYQKEGK